MSAPVLDLAAVKQRQQQAWSAGDFSAVGSRIAIVGETLCEAVDLRAGNRVLDVACGSGTAAIAAARRFCEVVGVDYVPALLERGRERAAAERLEVEFREGDAEALPFPDASFDVVLSTFGVMFAPDQAKAAAELLRVCRPGGKIGLANWTPDSTAGQMFGLTARYLPPPPGLVPPTRWGTEEGLRALLGEGITDLKIERRHAVMRAVTPEAWLDFFRTNFGPMVRAFAALDEAQGKAYGGELLDLVRANNQADDGTLASPSEYLEVVAKRR